MQTISEIMTPNVHTIPPDAPIEKAAQEMREGDFGVMPVGDKNQLLGIITDCDIVVRAVATGKGLSTPVRDVMSQDVVWVREDATVEEGAQIMSEHQIRRLPVVDANQRLVG